MVNIGGKEERQQTTFGQTGICGLFVYEFIYHVPLLGLIPPFSLGVLDGKTLRCSNRELSEIIPAALNRLPVLYESLKAQGPYFKQV